MNRREVINNKGQLGSFLKLAFWLSLPFLGLGIFMGINILSDSVHYDSNLDRVATTFSAGMRWITTSSLHLWALTPKRLNTWNRLHGDEFESIFYFHEILQSLILHENALLYGNETMRIGITKLPEDHYSLMYENGCVGFCIEYQHQNRYARDLLQGVHVALELYILHSEDLYREFLSYYNLSNIESYNISTTWEDVERKKVFAMDYHSSQFLTQPLKTSMEYYIEATTELIDNQIQKKLINTFLMVLYLALTYFIVVRTFSYMDREIRQTKILLLLLPGDVFKSAPSVMDFVER